MESKPTIVWHYETSTLVSVFDSEEERDKEYAKLLSNILIGRTHYVTSDTVYNLQNVAYITKGEQEEWKSASEH